MSSNGIFERDFDKLEPGVEFTTAARTITESDLVSFAALTGDRHPLHTDARWAAASPFGERVAHGMLLLSYALGLVPFDPTRVVALRGVDGVVFKRPAHIGDTIRVEGAIESLEPLDEAAGLVTCRWKVLNDRDETLARAKLRVLWRRETSEAGAGRSGVCIRRRSTCDPRRQADPRHRGRQPTQHRLRGRRAGPARRRRGAADELRPRALDDRARGEAPPKDGGRARARRQPDRGLRARCARSSSGRWGGIDGAVHAIAFAPPDALGGEFLNTPRESATVAFQTSAFSLKALAEALLPLYTNANGSEPGGGSLVGLDFDASVAWPAYDWMGVSKAALEAASRYLARDLGPHGVRVNLVSAGPIATPAAGGIPGFSQLADLWGAQAPLGWDVRDPTPVAQAIAFLLSDMSRGISGEIVHVDGGFHAMGAPMEQHADEPVVSSSSS